MARKTNAQLVAENKRLRAQIARKGKSKGTKRQIFKNVTGYPCKSAWTANLSSNRIVRHLHGHCGCNKKASFQCKAVKNYGFSWNDRGSDPSATWIDLPV